MTEEISTFELGTPVLVTTAHRGVFFGYLASAPKKDFVDLKDLRNCLYWERELKGFIGLAERGPQGGSRVGPKTAKGRLYDITSVLECAPTAVEAWESAPWSS